MNSFTRVSARGVIAAAAAAGLVAGGGVATAQLPGGDTGGEVVKVDGTDLVVAVDDQEDDAATITGTITNASDEAYRCATPGIDLEGENPGQVTTGEVAALTLHYYATNVFTGPDGFELLDGDPIGFGSVMDLIPAGSAVGSAEIDARTIQQQARVAGHTGTPLVDGNEVFTIEPGEDNTVDWTATLGTPASGDRGQWQAAALFYCINQSTDIHHVFAGFEGGEAPDIDPDTTGSLPTGSLGS